MTAEISKKIALIHILREINFGALVTLKSKILIIMKALEVCGGQNLHKSNLFEF